MKQEFKVTVNVKQYEDEPTDIVSVEDCVNNGLHNYFRSLKQDGEIEDYTLDVKEVEQPKSIKPWELIMPFFEIGKTYRIKFTDLVDVVVEYKCMVLEKNGGNLNVQVFEKDGKPDRTKTCINYKWIDRIEEVKGE